MYIGISPIIFRDGLEMGDRRLRRHPDLGVASISDSTHPPGPRMLPTARYDRLKLRFAIESTETRLNTHLVEVNDTND